MGVLDSLRRGGVEWSVELERDGLLPGQAARGRVTFTVGHRIEARKAAALLWDAVYAVPSGLIIRGL